MATKKQNGSGRYTVLRDFGGNVAGDVIELAADAAADLVRDGLVAPAEEG
jgi:hypothetical protein